MLGSPWNYMKTEYYAKRPRFPDFDSSSKVKTENTFYFVWKWTLKMCCLSHINTSERDTVVSLENSSGLNIDYAANINIYNHYIWIRH